ncbi:MAG: glutamine--fructose-6-phosphate transaminase (isomerizing) [Clostridia bacterium]|nr:glutamine--fructose-6-phosphate transaminase (isomerizing) [Clostridia bacterium]
MCGIFGTIGEHSVDNTLSALKRLEYRGYDSAGVAVKTADGISVFKQAGRVEQLKTLVPQDLVASVAIGHTRWATHGEVSESNAHPFYSFDNKFAIVHNGIIENFAELKSGLTEQGVKFSSQTDSEVIAHLIAKHCQGDVLKAVLSTASMLNGSFATVVQNTYDDNLYGIKNKSPLIVGVNGQTVYFCSDVRCMSQYATRIAQTPDNTVVVATPKGEIYFYDFNGKSKNVKFFDVDKVEDILDCDDYMLKEILEIPTKIRQAKQGYFQSGGLNLSAKTVHRIKRIYLIGCGTAYNSGLQVAASAREMLDIDVLPVIASEFIYDNYPVDSSTLAFLISQSGETADTIRAAEKVKQMGGYTYAVTNTDTSTLRYACDKAKNICADGEFAVASTKAYNCQLITLTLLLADIAYIKGSIDEETHKRIANSVDLLSVAVETVLNNSYQIASIAEEIKDSKAVFFLGRVADYPTACEGSLKLKEISYIHSEAYPTGELKHGTLALMEQGVTVIAIATDSALVDKMAVGIAEVITRGARVVCVSPYAFDNVTAVNIPVVNRYMRGVLSVVPLQLLAYYVAKRLGRDVDKPRNLAKSVTVE